MATNKLSPEWEAAIQRMLQELEQAPQPDLLTREEAAAWLRVHERTVDRLRNRGELPAVRIGQRVLYRFEVLRAFVAAKESVRGVRP